MRTRQRVKSAQTLAVYLTLNLSVAQGEVAREREDGDYNFDGHEDYRLESEHPGNQCGWWDYYLFDPGTRSHRLVETGFCKEQFDSQRMLVITQISGGMAGLIYAIRHYRWDGLDPVPVYVEAQDYDPARKLFIRTRVTNIDHVGGPTVTSDILTPDDVEANPILLD